MTLLSVPDADESKLDLEPLPFRAPAEPASVTLTRLLPLTLGALGALSTVTGPPWGVPRHSAGHLSSHLA